MVDDVVSIKAMNTDVCVSTTANSKYNVKDIQVTLDINYFMNYTNTVITNPSSINLMASIQCRKMEIVNQLFQDWGYLGLSS